MPSPKTICENYVLMELPLPGVCRGAIFTVASEQIGSLAVKHTRIRSFHAGIMKREDTSRALMMRHGLFRRIKGIYNVF